MYISIYTQSGMAFNMNYNLVEPEKICLFNGIETGDLDALLNCLGAAKKTFIKGEIILLAGDTPRHVGIVLTGQLHIIREDHDGNRALIAVAAPGEIFAEALCCAGVSESPVTVMAEADSTVLLLDFTRVLKTCSNSCSFHTKLIENMLRLIAGKNIFLQNRMEIVSLKSVRAKIMLYLETFQIKHGHKFSIPLNREEMADYLCVDRSALSHELARMKKDGFIDYRKNCFTLLYR